MSNVQRPTPKDKSLLESTMYFFRRHSSGRRILLLSIMVSFFSCTASGVARETPDPPYAPGELIVAFHETVPEERIVKIVGEEGGRIGRTLGGFHLFLIHLPEEMDIAKAAE